MKYSVLSLFLLLTFFCHSQTTSNEHQIYLDNLAQSTKTLVINISGLSHNVIGEFKDELIAWKGKVVSIDINETQPTMTIVHYKILEQKEMFDVLGKYGIKISRITSYQ